MADMAIQVPINLATEPFRRDRPILVAFAGGAVVLVVLLAIQVATILTERHQGADIHVTINHLNSQLRAISSEQAKIAATMRRPENSVVLERSLFLNTLIDRKAISWTRLFADLEKVVPYNARLISVRLTDADQQNRIPLDIVVGAKDFAPILTMQKNLEASPLFEAPIVLSSAPPTQTDPLTRYHLVVTYAQKL
jgi:Tfp pilus assembly protein PilN